MLNKYLKADLSKELQTITIMDFRRNPGEIVEAVRLGKSFIITKKGKPVAVFQPLPGEKLTVKINSNGKQSYSL